MLKVELRPATELDRPTIAALINAHSQAVVGTARALIDADGNLRRARYVPQTAEQYLAVTPNGDAIGYVYLTADAPYVVQEMGGAVLPEYWGRGVGTQLLGWAEERARARLSSAPAGARVVLQAQVLEADTLALELLTANGFALVRQWLHLEMALTQPPPVPVWPDGFAPRLLERARDWNAVFVALEDAFADHWGVVPPQTASTPEEAEPDEEEEEADDEIDLYSNTRGLCFAAMHGDEVVGSALCNARTVEWADTGKLGSLSIRRSFRGRGLARALTLTALGQFYQRGLRRIITDTDSQNFTGSYNLYFSVGMRPYRYENVYEKELRAGREWRILKPEDAPPHA